MDLTRSWEKVLPAQMVERYDVAETRNAAAVLEASNPSEFADIVAVLSELELHVEDIVKAGGNKSLVAARLDVAFRQRGWREGQYEVHVKTTLVRQPWKPAGESRLEPVITDAVQHGYRVDNLKARVALDGEWNAKDGNLARDLAAYRVFYDHGIIDVAVMVTRVQEEMKALARQLGVEKRFDTTTTTNLEKLLPMMRRGDAGGCPFLAIAITPRCLVQQ